MTIVEIIIAIIVIVTLSVGVIIYQRLVLVINPCSKHLVGKVVIVTGGNAGIGFETAKDLAFRGAKVIIACRNEGRGAAARDKIIAASENPDVHYMNLDLASLASVRRFADEFTKSQKRLDILINNAGVVDSEFQTTEDGLLYTMQVNHFGPFLLTNLLLPVLKSSAPSRIINVSSIFYKVNQIDLNDLNVEKRSKSPYLFINVYGNSKLCNILMTIELKRRLEGTGVTTNCLHPGMVRTMIMNGVTKWWDKNMYVPIINLFSKSAWQGAQTTIYLAVSSEVKNVSGCYFQNCKIKNTAKIAKDSNIAQKLWDISEKIVDL